MKATLLWLVDRGRITLWLTITAILYLCVDDQISGEKAVGAIERLAMIALGAEAVATGFAVAQPKDPKPKEPQPNAEEENV